MQRIICKRMSRGKIEREYGPQNLDSEKDDGVVMKTDDD
jgi:hypothetical protein